MRMGKEKNYIDEYFKEGLGNFDLIPPADVWKNIERELDHKRRIGIITFWSGLAAGLALFVGIGGYYYFEKKQTTQVVASVHKHDEASNSKVIKHPADSSYIIASTLKSGSNMTSGEKLSSQVVQKSNADIDESQIKSEVVESAKETDIIKSTLNQNLASFDVNSKTNLTNRETILMINPKTIVFSEPQQNKLVMPGIVPNNNSVNLLVLSDLSEPELPQIKHWSIEGQVAPQYSYRSILNVTGGSSSKGQFNSQEEGLVAYAGGLKVSYETSSRLSFQLGIVYSVMGQTLKDVYSVSEVQTSSKIAATEVSLNVANYWASNSLGPIEDRKSSVKGLMIVQSSLSDATKYNSLINNRYTTDNLSAPSKADVQLIQQQKYIEIPLLARYMLIDKKIGLHVVGGFSTNLMVDNNVIAQSGNSKENIGETANLRFLNYNSNIGFGLDYKWWGKAILTIEPTFKYYLNSISDKSDINYHPYSFGIFTGVRYKF